MSSASVQELRAFLQGLKSGVVEDRATLGILLSAAWRDLDGSGEEGTTGTKLGSRVEKPVWDPPHLLFLLERHGPTVMGSSRANVHHWSVDVDAGTARIVGRSHRQLHPMDPRLNVPGLADELTALVNSRVDDERLDWSPDRTQVKFNISVIVPKTNQQTTTSRRRRLSEALEPRLNQIGWFRIGQHRYELSTTPSSP
jgi:hypothetical protein